MASSASVSTFDRGSFDPVFTTLTVTRLRHFANVFGLIPDSWLNCASEAYDRCLAGLTKRAVVALL